jgi:PilZ domain
MDTGLMTMHASPLRTPTAAEVAQALVAESALDMLDDAGMTVEVWTISCNGETVDATAPRLQVQDGMTLTTDLLMDGLPYAVTVRVDQAGYRTEKRASLRMRVTRVEPAGARRGEERVELTGSGELHALSCDRLPDRHEFRVALSNISSGGVAFRADDVRLTPGDLLALHCRFFEGTLDAAARVVAVTPVRPGDLRVGCRLEALDVPTATMLGQVIERLRGDDRAQESRLGDSNPGPRHYE